jgi:hypothetical protein
MHAGVGRLTASLLLTVAAAHGATAMAADAAPALNYSLGGSFASGLFAAGIGQQDECDEPAPLDEGLANALADNRDMLLASLDTDKAVRKPARAAARAVERAAAPAEPVVPAPPAAPGWEIMVSDKTLNAALQRWAAAAGWQLLWELPVDYAVEARTTVPGNFDEAVNTVVKSMESAEIPMKAVFYQGNKVLRIMVKGSE